MGLKNIDDKIYNLAIKRAKNDYMPLEWNLTSLYKGQNLQTLEGIDNFTSQTTELELVKQLIKDNLISLEDKFQTFAIIFKEKGRIRELPEGPCFSENYEFLNANTIYYFLCNNYNDKILMNKIYNYLEKVDDTPATHELRYIINNIDYFYSKGQKVVDVALLKIQELDYFTLRKLSMYISKKLLPEMNSNKKISKEN